mgnify:CR=1 FL=1
MRSLVEWLGDTLLESRIMEQAMTRKDFKMKFHHSIDRIIENWCMIRYAEVTGQEKYSGCINHWKQELRASMNNVSKYELKPGNIRSVINDVFDEKMGDWHKNRREAMRYVTRVMTKKLDDEGYYLVSKERGIIDDIASEFIDNIDTIVNVICSDDYEDMREYIYNL